ncbi:hypothetical protein G9A89_005626 [Geosiphon pyriformis]|nr:hypothetical protein G9A89_005626 [Geosiphon pyriformis]
MVDGAALTPDCQACANGDANLLTCTGASSASEITNLPKATISKCFCKQSSIDAYASCFKCPSSVEYQSTDSVSVSDAISNCKLYNPNIILIDPNPTKPTTSTSKTATIPTTIYSTTTYSTPKLSPTLTISPISSSTLTESAENEPIITVTKTTTVTHTSSNANNTKFNGIRTDIVAVFLLIIVSIIFLL